MSERPVTVSKADRAAVKPQGLMSGQVSVTHLVVFVVAAAAPLTLMAGVAPVAIAIGGVGAPAAYLFAMVVLALFAVGYVAMAKHIRNSGAFFAFISAGLGRALGGAAGVMTLIAYFMFTIGQTIGSAVFAQMAIGYFTGFTVPWPYLALGVALLFGWLGYNRVTLNGRVLATAIALEMVLLLVLAAAVFIQGGSDGFTFGSFQPENVFAPGMAVVLIFSFGAFMGVEATAIYSEEAKDPRKTVPRATYIAVFLLGLFYALIIWMIVIAFGEETVTEAAAQDPEGLFFVAMEQYVGGFGVGTMYLMLFVSVFASTLAFHNESTRYMFSLGRGGMLPKFFAKTQAKTHSPYVAGFFQIGVVFVMILIFALMDIDPYLEGFIFMASAAVVGVLTTQWLSMLAVIAFFSRTPHGTSLWQRLLAPLLAFAGLGVAIYLMLVNFELLTGVEGGVNVALFVPLVVGFVGGFIRALTMKNNSPKLLDERPEDTADALSTSTEK